MKNETLQLRLWSLQKILEDTGIEVENAEIIEKDFAPLSKVKQIKLERWKKIDIKDLNFSYEDKEGRLDLEDIDLSIHHNERIALVGESGSGKTTFFEIATITPRPGHRSRHA